MQACTPGTAKGIENFHALVFIVGLSTADIA